MNKHNLFNKIRKQLKLPQSDRTYFRLNEVKAIVSCIMPELSPEEVDSKTLSSIPGWVSQATVSPIPTRRTWLKLLK